MRRSLPFLFLALLVPWVSSESTEAWTKGDGENDVVVDVNGPAQAPLALSQATSHVDLTRIRIEDPNEALLLFHLKNVAGFRTTPISGRLVTWDLIAKHSVVFAIPSLEGARTFAIVDVENDIDAFNPSQAAVSFARVCITTNAAATRCNYDMVGQDVRFRSKDGELTIEVPKRLLAKGGHTADRFRSVPPLPERIPMGSSLERLVVHSALSYGAGRLVDRIPDSGDGFSYPLQHASPAGDLAIRADAGAVVAGETTLVNLRIQNNATGKRLLNLSLVPDGGWPSGWSGAVTPRVTVGGGSMVNATLRITAPADATTGPPVRIWIYARVVSDPGTSGVGELLFSAVPALDASHATWFIHGRYPSTPLLPEGVPYYGNSYGFTVLSRLAEDARAADQTRLRHSYQSSSGGSTLVEWRMRDSFDAIPNAAKFVVGRAGTAHLAAVASRDYTGDLLFQVLLGEREVARHQSTTTIKAGQRDLDLPLTLTKDATTASPADGLFHAVLQFRTSSATGIYNGFVDELALIPKKSWFSLPLERDTEAVSASTKRLVTLSPAKGQDGFVNPGGRRVAELDLRNGEPGPVRIRLELANLTAGWVSDLRPGTNLRLGASDSVRVAVLLRAPDDAPEGQALSARLVARDAETEEELSSAPIQATVTRGVEIANETYQASSEDAGKVEPPARGSPGATALGALVVSGGAAWWSRRRRSAPPGSGQESLF